MGVLASCCRKGRGGDRDAINTAFQSDLKTPLITDLYSSLPDTTPVVIVKLVGGHDLPVSDVLAGSSDPFVEFFLRPAEKNAGAQKQRSTHKPRSLNPRWEPPEKFKFICTDLSFTRIVISVMDYQASGNHAPMGDAALACKDLTESPQRKRIKLVSPATGKFKGELEVDVYLSTTGEMGSVIEHRAYEFQRWQTVVGWGSDYPGHLLPTDPGRWCSADGQKFNSKFEAVIPPVPDGWYVKTPWTTVSTEDDAEGWQYGVDFNSADWFSTPNAQGSGLVGTFVRRRLWIREVTSRAPHS